MTSPDELGHFDKTAAFELLRTLNTIPDATPTTANELRGTYRSTLDHLTANPTAARQALHTLNCCALRLLRSCASARAEQYEEGAMNHVLDEMVMHVFREETASRA
ncbi:hypothetical protein [Streptomyces sp. CS014]|uniref:hypothetical protein n=1 Tax=Streptomyces sp. CS014 TaxID=2162707 RepID=UPI000D50B01E|nr:hypothetical protein [Streptomyces sp. CS014]PVD04429.1 hypothetical protein DBP12_03115 [Streptomyces sp. CS014]